jgi:hypothetical protein
MQMDLDTRAAGCLDGEPQGTSPVRNRTPTLGRTREDGTH